MSKYKKNKNWNMFVEENKLFITKGADEIYYMDDIAEDDANNIYKAYCDEKYEDIDAIILKKLERVGVIYQNFLKNDTSKIKVCLKYYGTNTTKLKECLKEIIKKRNHINIVDKAENSDLLIMIRVNGKIKNVLQNYEEIKVPHLFVDVAYANTISIGPLVYKEKTACLGCFFGRLTRNWGDLVPPEEPQISKKSELISSLIIEKIEEFQTYGNCPNLVNGVWNFNLQEFTSKLDRVHKLPWCPICKQEKENGKISLPWINN